MRCLRYAKRTTLYKGTRNDLGHEHLRGQPSHGVLHLEWRHRATRLRPDDPTVLLQLADAEWAAGLHGEAAKHYQYLLERAPKHAGRRRILERLAEGGDPAVR